MKLSLARQLNVNPIFKNRTTSLLLMIAVMTFLVWPSWVSAEIRTVYLSKNASALSSLQLIKGADINLVNLDHEKMEELSLVDIVNGKRVFSIDELQAGQSVQIGFDKPGSYLLAFKVGTVNFKDVYKRLFIEVVNANSA